MAPGHFGYFFLPPLMYELLTLAGGFKEMQKSTPKSAAAGGMLKVSGGFLASQLEKTRMRNEEHFCYGWSYYESAYSFKH